MRLKLTFFRLLTISKSYNVCMKVITLVFMILGCFLGAGFVSGREIASYFSRFGSSSIFAIIVAGVFFFLCLYLFLRLSEKADNYSKFISLYFGKYGVIINCLFSLSVFILISSMIAGTSSIATTLGINQIVFLSITLIICFFAVSGSDKMLSKINFILMPIILVIILLVCGVNFEITSSANGGFFPIVSSTNYVLINIVTLGLFILEIGHKYTNKQKLIASIITSLIIMFFMFVINSAILDNELISTPMPILELAKVKGGLMSILTAIVIWCGLFTTIISCVFILSNFLNKFINNYKLTVGIILVTALITSIVGFEFMVSYIYSIIGVIGLIFMIFIIKKERETTIQIASRRK